MLDRFQKITGYDSGSYGDPTMQRSAGGVAGGLGDGQAPTQWRKKLAGILGDVGRLFPKEDDEHLEPSPMQQPQIYPRRQMRTPTMPSQY